MRTRMTGPGAALLTLGLMAMGGAAHADTDPTEGGALAANQVNLPITVPVAACGNTAAVLGDAASLCDLRRPGPRPGSRPAKPHPASPHHPRPEAGQLPRTGDNTGPLLAIGVAAIVAGLGLLRLAHVVSAPVRRRDPA